MAVTYTWTFSPLEVTLAEDGLTNVVKVVHWRLTGVDGEQSETVYGSEAMDSPDPLSFVDYEDLTKATVQEWVETKMGVERVQQYKDTIVSSINIKKNPVSAVLSPPWE